jgi:Ca-activated chloride channel family protein
VPLPEWIAPLPGAVTAAVAAFYVREHLRGARKLPALRFPAWSWLPPGELRRRRPFRPALALRAAAAIALAPLAAGWPVPRETGRDAVMLVVDASSSMSADDFGPGDRLDAVRRELGRLVRRRTDLDFGLIAFAGAPVLLVPVTARHAAVGAALDEVMLPGFEEDGTAVGASLGSALNRLREGPWRRRRVLLVTDGVDNRGPLQPGDAARIARALEIPVDVVGIGTGEPSRYAVPTPSGTTLRIEARIEIDTRTLAEVAAVTGGSYRPARNAGELRAALDRAEAGWPAAPQPRPDRWPERLAQAVVVLLALEILWTRVALPEIPG